MNRLSLQNLIQHGVDILLALVGVDVEVGIAREHRRQLRLRFVIENVAGDAVSLSIGQFVAHAQRGTGTLTDEHIALAQPRRVLIIDTRIAFTSLLHKTQVALAYMLGQHHVGALDVTDDAVVQVSVHASTTNRPCKINLLCHIFALFFQLTKISELLEINKYGCFLKFQKNQLLEKMG